MSRLKVLLLGGTAEASALAERIAEDARFEGTLSLAGVTRSPRASPLAMRTGGFGGADGLAAWLRQHDIDALIDATHPFAAAMSANAAAAAAAASVPAIALLRPAWQEQPGDRWIRVPDMPSAAAALGIAARTVFLTIGRKDLALFRAAPQHRYIVRSVDPPPPDLLPEGAIFIAARGPFALEDEERLLGEYRIETIVTKNSGGTATAAKLAAARRAGLPVVMVERPPVAGPTVPTVEEAWEWLVALHGEGTSARRGV
ncbi:MAG: cobalt-precorrin-6A reductase [Rhodospirillaceae bacterium]|nr:cobalt-precorrin-6A reductase [Rhodospirillaceae bacterium]